MSWTPGPWKILYSESYKRYGATIATSNDDGYIADVYYRGAKTGFEHNGNARLIAHAPAMAVLLRRLAEEYGCECLDTERTPHCAMCDARALLRQIEGG